MPITIISLLFVLLSLFQKGSAYDSTKPIWLTSNYMRAGNENVISVLTGQDIDPIYTFTFSSALPGVPNLAYGIRRYRGADYMGVEQFEIRRLNLTASTFTVQVDIIGVTNLYIVNVPYIAVDPTFPHHLNSFDNVPISYGTNLTNITVKSVAPTSFTNYINYTEQAAGRKYTQFGTPLSGNKMLLYICALHIWATFRYNFTINFRSGTIMYPIDLHISYNIENQTTYKLAATLSTKVYIAKLHFSQIVYNADDVQSSKKYVIVYQIWETTNMGGFLEFPEEFVDNFIMGVTDFSSIDGKCGFEYQWFFVTRNLTFGVEIVESKQISGDCGFSRMTSTVFYMKTWQCPQTNPYFNLTTNLCQDSCALFNYENKTVYQCNLCEFSCPRCLNSTVCLECDSVNHHRKLFIGTDNSSCLCMDGFYQDPSNATNKICLACSKNCVSCKNSSKCLACNQTAGYILTANFTCKFCGIGCKACVSVNQGCLACRDTFSLNSQTKKCQCPNGTVFLPKNLTCITCHQKCMTCAGPTQYECTSCFPDQNRVTIKQANGLVHCMCNPFNYVEPTDGTFICVKKSQQSCDYGFIYIKEEKRCVQICGDGKSFGNFQCDDGNRIDGDGCSKTCQIEQGFNCSVVNGTSVCMYVGSVDIVSAVSYKNPYGNHLLIMCELSPIKEFFYSLKWKQGLMLIGPNMTVIDAWMENKWLNINTTYFQDLTGKTLTIKYSSSLANNSKNKTRRLFNSVFDFDLILRDYDLPIAPANNIKPSLLEETTYQKVQILQKASFIIAICTIAFISFSLMLRTVFPIWQMVFCLQTIFLSLGTMKSINALLSGLTEFSFIKGFRSSVMTVEGQISQDLSMEYNIRVLGYGGSLYDNMNVMLILQLTFMIATGALFLMSKKDLTMQFPFQFAKRQLMLLILFNAMNLSLSLGLIRDVKPIEMAVACVASFVLLVQISHLFKKLKDYFYLDQTFNLTNSKVKFAVAAYILLKVAQALAISLFRSQTLISSSIVLGIQVIISLGFSIFKPYKVNLYNIFNFLCEWAVTAFLILTLLINLNKFQLQDNENLVSIVQICLNYLIVVIMVVCFWYAFFNDFCAKKNQSIKIVMQDEDFSPKKLQNLKLEGKKQVPSLSLHKLSHQILVEDINESNVWTRDDQKKQNLDEFGLLKNLKLFKR